MRDGAALLGGAMLGTTGSAAHLPIAAQSSSPAVQTRSSTGRPFRYTVVWGGALATTPLRRAYVPHHCGFGVVEDVGRDVRRVQVGVA